MSFIWSPAYLKPSVSITWTTSKRNPLLLFRCCLLHIQHSLILQHLSKLILYHFAFRQTGDKSIENTFVQCAYFPNGSLCHTFLQIKLPSRINIQVCIIEYSSWMQKIFILLVRHILASEKTKTLNIRSGSAMYPYSSSKSAGTWSLEVGKLQAGYRLPFFQHKEKQVFCGSVPSWIEKDEKTTDYFLQKWDSALYLHYS